MKCIFCNRTNLDFDEKNCFTEEHIIPKALGNEDLILNCVCKECNSKLGKYIDGYFVDNMLLKLPRQTVAVMLVITMFLLKPKKLKQVLQWTYCREFWNMDV